MPTKSCLTCGYSSLDPTKCPLIGYQYTENRNVCCPYYITDPVICCKCGRIIVSHSIVYIQTSDNTWQPICDDCNKLSGHCGGCSKSSTCDFETNPSPIPKAVQKTFKEGFQTIVTTVPNPSRVDITCRVNCPCFSEEFGCLRENGTCGNYEGAI